MKVAQNGFKRKIRPKGQVGFSPLGAIARRTLPDRKLGVNLRFSLSFSIIIIAKIFFKIKNCGICLLLVHPAGGDKKCPWLQRFSGAAGGAVACGAPICTHLGFQLKILLHHFYYTTYYLKSQIGGGGYRPQGIRGPKGTKIKLN